MCTRAQQIDIQKEMDAYDSLPPVVQKAFDKAPMKVSAYNTMRLPGFQKAFATNTPEKFAELITAHFAEEARIQAAGDRYVQTK